jgi:hypothetical protein
MSKKKILEGTRVYLSGPMDFLALPRKEERVNGWRARVSQFLVRYKVNVFDPWFKPEIRALHSYGREDDKSTEQRNKWNFTDSKAGSKLRSEICKLYWPTVHIDLRMVDSSDFLIAFCPTNTYSVGTVHEIALARQQHKPVLFVSPRCPITSLQKLEEHMTANGDKKGLALLKKLVLEQPIKPNLNAAPSIWYMGILDGDYFFDGFGFKQYKKEFKWKDGPLDELEEEFPPERPLLPYLEKLNNDLPKKFNLETGKYFDNDDWLIFDKEDDHVDVTTPNKQKNGKKL